MIQKFDGQTKLMVCQEISWKKVTILKWNTESLTYGAEEVSGGDGGEIAVLDKTASRHCLLKLESKFWQRQAYSYGVVVCITLVTVGKTETTGGGAYKRRRGKQCAL